MNRLTDELRQELQSQQGAPVPLVDDQTQRVYYIITSEQFERIRTLLVDEEFSPREMYPLIAKTAGDAGWNDPAMDAYNHDDGRQPKG